MPPPQKGPPPAIAISDLVTALQDSDNIVQLDVLVVRGYLGRSDLGDQTVALASKALGAYPADVAAITAALGRDELKAALPWRLYLSPRLDCYVEFESADVLAWRLEDQEANREDAYTVWLRTRKALPGDPASTVPVAYSVVETAPLQSATGYVRGGLIEDYMTRPESRNVVWDEQEYGPTTGKSSYRTCVG